MSARSLRAWLIVAIVLLPLVGAACIWPDIALLVVPFLLYAVGLVAVIGIWFLPWFVARERRHPNADAIFLLCLFAGWTVIGWVAAFIWAYVAPPRPVGHYSDQLGVPPGVDPVPRDWPRQSPPPPPAVSATDADLDEFAKWRRQGGR